eukprot:scaffold79_cov145-Amphora_coffeaeformis.AAC.1
MSKVLALVPFVATVWWHMDCHCQAPARFGRPPTLLEGARIGRVSSSSCWGLGSFSTPCYRWEKFCSLPSSASGE